VFVGLKISGLAGCPMHQLILSPTLVTGHSVGEAGSFLSVWVTHMYLR